MDDREPFLNYSRYLQRKYGKTAYRVSIDGGFSCPNRGESRDNPGCTYCSSYGARSAYIGETESNIKNQIERNLNLLKSRYNAQIFMLYFQAYSSTWAPVDELKTLYDYSLSLGDFRELIVSTRPDCLSEEICEFLTSYKSDNFEVWIELGLQSSSDVTLERINRGHTRAQFEEAFNLLRSYGLKIVVHLIFGLPGENHNMIMDTVTYAASLRPEGVKFHNLHIPDKTEMHDELMAGEMAIPSSSGHVRYLADAIERFHRDTIIMRLTTDTPRQRHLIPGYMLDKTIIYNRVREELLKRGTKQGVYFPNNTI
ncbi:MAG: TIGR01212 family radical SAM protein [Spirochaetaceae bacterium]|nr:TIGR01212 family radical SAM protein [Spirochaetaceae bacterium]